MPKELSVSKINMYLDMVDREFAPLMNEVKAMESTIKQQVKQQAMEDLGLNDLKQELDAIQAQIDEIIARADPYAKLDWSSWDKRFDFKLCDDFNSIVETRMRVCRKGPIEQTYKALNDAQDAIKLAGVGQDVRNAFDRIPKVLESLKHQFAALPDPAEYLEQIPDLAA